MILKPRNKPNRWLISALCSFLLLGTSSAVTAAPEADSLAWATSPSGGQVKILGYHGVPTGSVVNTGRTFAEWGEASALTWHIYNNLSGEHQITFSYRTSQDVPYRLTVGEQTHEGVLKSGTVVQKESVPAVLLERVGVYPVTLSITSDSATNDFELTDMRMRMLPAEVAMSKPVLIASGDWLKIQGSLEVKSDAIQAADVQVHATIRPLPAGEVIWQGKLNPELVTGGIELDQTITGLKPKLWSPDSPQLYEVALEVGTAAAEKPIIRSLSRIGFRDFEAKDGRFYLNGTPVLLRGKSIIPPGAAGHRDLNPDLAHDPVEIRKYLLRLKEFNVNLVRSHNPVWLSISDEVGMMNFTGRYGVPRWGNAKRHHAPEFEQGAVTYYKRTFAENYMNHPSVVIWVLTNEVPSAANEQGQQYIKFLKQCYDQLSKWDPTRAYIENAGFGLGQAGDINDFHVYMGWYNGIGPSVYKFRDNLRELAGLPAPLQPMAFTEILGIYTDKRGRMPATGKMVSAGLMWGGNQSDVPEYALGYQSYLTSEFLEILRRIRPMNPRIAGLMPFTTTAMDWTSVKSVEEIEFKPHMTEALTTAYQPVLLSFENWRPHAYAGDSLSIKAHVVNDADDGRDLKKAALQWQLIREADQQQVAEGTVAFARKIKHYSSDVRELELELDAHLQQGQYTLVGQLLDAGAVVSTNKTGIWIEPRQLPEFVSARKISLYDPMSETKPLLEKAGLVEGKDFFITTSPLAGMRAFDSLSGSQLQETLGVEGISGDTLVAPAKSVLIIGTKQWVEPLRDKYLLMKEFIKRGGRVVFLHPNAHANNDIGIFEELMVAENEWVGDRESVDMESLWHTSRTFGAWINPRRSDNAIFDSISQEQLWLWSDASGWDANQPDLPKFQPVDKLMKLRDAEAMESTAVLANFGRGLEYVALAEVFRGEGSVILSGFDFDRFAGFDPIADKVLRGIIAYAGDDQQHEIVPVAKDFVNMGSPSDEDGLITSEFRNGLLLEYTLDYQVRRIAGPFWFNRLCHTKLIDQDNPQREGFLHLRPPAGKTEVVFQLRRVPTRQNKGRYQPETLTVTLGDQKAEAVVAGEEEVELRMALPEDVEQPIKVVFQGLDDMGISSMSFQ